MNKQEFDEAIDEKIEEVRRVLKKRCATCADEGVEFPGTWSAGKMRREFKFEVSLYPCDLSKQSMGNQ